MKLSSFLFQLPTKVNRFEIPILAMNLTLKKKTGCLLIIRTNALKDWLSEGDNHLGKVRAQYVCHAIYLFLSVFVLLNNSYLWYWKYRPLVFALWDICVMEHSSTKRDRSSRFLEQSRVLYRRSNSHLKRLSTLLIYNMEFKPFSVIYSIKMV